LNSTGQGLYSKIPNGNKHWYITGRPEGKRVRAWFDTKEKAQAEAKECNSYLRDVLTRLPSMTNRQIKDIVPKAWAAAEKAATTRKAA
jgi:transposase